MKNQLLNDMESALNKIKESGKMDSGFLECMLEFGYYLDKIKSQWLEYASTDGFYFYQAAQNMKLILGKIQDRFRDAEKANDDSGIVSDTIAILPQFDKTLCLLEPHKITAESIDAMLDQTRILQDIAYSKNLTESVIIDGESLDTDSLKHSFNSLLSQLSANSTRYN